MKHRYEEVNLRGASLALVERCNDIIEEYQQQRLVLTLRQLYYQLVSRDIIPNVERSYKNLSTLVTKARMGGLMDWDAIEDRGRRARAPNEYRDLEQLVDAALWSYRLPRWADQYCYVELWVEKEALAGVLSPIAVKWHVTLMVNKGYSSASAMRESSLRFRRHESQKLYLLYLGDHDPSGEDMVRDIRDRMVTFGVEYLHVEKLALTMDQVRKYNPPPNPAKVSDPRAVEYIRKYGDSSWEVDALPPTVLRDIIESRVGQIVELDKYEAVKEREEKDKDRLREMVKEIVS